MSAYYSEHDPFAAAWLRELIKAGLIADGEVDERDIQDVQPGDIAGFVQCHFFAGIGGWSYALRLAGWPDDRPVWTGSCPCQPFSSAGKGHGGSDVRHLWPIWGALIKECKPATVFGEQVANSLSWLDAVATDLETSNYAFAAADLPAAGVGALHRRQRLFFVAADSDAVRPRLQRLVPVQAAASPREWNANELERVVSDQLRSALPTGKHGLLSHGLPSRVGQLRGYGNAIVPQVAAQFIGAYLDTLAEPRG